MDLNIRAFDIMFLVPAAVQICLALLYIGIDKRNEKIEKKMNKNNFVIRPSGVMVWFSFCMGMLFFLFLLFIITDFDFWMTISLVTMSTVCFIIFWAGMTEKMIINGNKFVICHLFRKRKEYSFDDIARIDIVTHSSDSTGIEVQIIGIENKKLFACSPKYTGYNKFISLARKRGIEIKYKEKKGIYKGSLF